MTLHLLDAYRQPFSGTYDVKLLSMSSDRELVNEKGRSASTVQFDGLTEMALYRAEFSAAGYQPASFTGYGDSRGKVALLIDPDGVTSVTWPALVPDDVRALWADLPEVKKACLLNIRAKLVAVGLWERVEDITSVSQDRIYARVTEDMKAALSRSPEWREVSGSLHEPPPGAVLDSSWKHVVYEAGVLQVTLFRAGDAWLADIDIDLARGIAHGVEVARNHTTGSKTHPYTVHQILVYRQGIDPGYRLKVTA